MCKNYSSSKRSLVTTLVVLAICAVIVTGSTFSLFTSETGVNIAITAGNVKMTAKINEALKLYSKDVEQTTGNFENGGTATLNEEKTTLTVANITPGDKVELKINLKNESNVDVAYRVTWSVEGELAGVLTGTVDTKPFTAGTSEWTKWAAPANEDAKTKTITLAVAFPMDIKKIDGEKINYNYYQGKTANITFAVEAVQANGTAEYDNTAYVNTAAGLQAAIDAGATKLILNEDVVLTNSLVIPAAPATYSLRETPKTITLDLKGKTISNPNGYVIENQGNIVITGNGTLTGMGIIRSKAGSVVIENGNFYASSDYHDGNYQHTMKAENTNVVINGGNFDATVNGQTNAMIGVAENAVVTINGGNFKNVAGDLSKFDPYMFNYEKNGKVIINDGTFYGGWRFNGETATTDIYGGNFTVGFDGQSFHASSTHVVTVYGGTFVSQTYAKLTAKLADIVADGYKAVANTADGTYSVIFPQESFDALLENAVEGEPVQIPAGNFTVSGKNNLIIVGSGANTVINFGQSIENVNVSNVTIAGEPRLAVKSGQTATFNNVTFTGTKAWGSVHGVATFNGCTFNGLLHIDSSADTTTIKFVDCTFDEYSIIKLGGSADYILENCVVEKLAADATGAWGKEWLITYCDTTFTECELGRVIRAGKTINITINDCVDADGEAVDADIVHKNASPIVYIDDVQWVKTAITGTAPAPYVGECYDEGTNVVAYKDIKLVGDAYILIDNNASVAIENVTANTNGSVVVMKDYQPAIYIYGGNYTIAEGAYLIDASAVSGGVYQIFLVNVTVNGELLTQDTAAQYLNNVNWYGAYIFE